MVRSVAIEGADVVVSFGRKNTADDSAGTRRSLVAVSANDNAPRDATKTVTVRRQLEKSGVAIKIKVPVHEFVGVAVATSISEEGVLTSTIELVHGNPELNYRVFEEEGNSNVVSEWQNWGRKLRLPLFIRAGDGSLMAYSQQVDGLALGDVTSRRKLAGEAGRRPRFLNRRKPGAST